MLAKKRKTRKFQLTTSRRGRPGLEPYMYCNHPISTHHDLTKRSTQRMKATILWNLYFNSRPHEEVDQQLRQLLNTSPVISTHDLTKRSTNTKSICFWITFSFQLTTSRRGRQQNCIFYSSLLHLLLAHCTNNLYPIIIIYIILTF